MEELIIEKTETLSDGQLVSLINSGSYEYLQPLINRYMPYIIKTAGKYKSVALDVEDLISEAILSVFSAVKAFDETKSSFRSFVILCINRSISTQIKSHNAAHRVPANMLSSIDEVELFDDKSPEKVLIEKESYLSLADVIKNDLSELEYNVFCEFLAGNSYMEIAEKLHISVKSVDNALKRIRTKLKR